LDPVRQFGRCQEAQKCLRITLNFVSSSREKIEAAKAAWAAGDWEEGRFRLPPTDDSEHIPLPER